MKSIEVCLYKGVKDLEEHGNMKDNARENEEAINMNHRFKIDNTGTNK